MMSPRYVIIIFAHRTKRTEETSRQHALIAHATGEWVLADVDHQPFVARVVYEPLHHVLVKDAHLSRINVEARDVFPIGQRLEVGLRPRFRGREVGEIQGSRLQPLKLPVDDVAELVLLIHPAGSPDTRLELVYLLKLGDVEKGVRVGDKHGALWTYLCARR